MVARKSFTRASKIEAVRLLELGEKPASQLGVRRGQLYRWRDQNEGKGEAGAIQGSSLDSILFSPAWRRTSG